MKLSFLPTLTFVALILLGTGCQTAEKGPQVMAAEGLVKNIQKF